MKQVRIQGRQVGIVMFMSMAGFVACGFLGAVLFMLVDIPLRLTPNEPPFQWGEPMGWTALACAIVGSFSIAFFTWRHFETRARG